MTRRYFEEEMRYLHEAGKVFAETHPEQARYLNIDSISDRDPYVERLFEGFAFLTGRIRESLDDELPQYTESLCNLLFPHFIRPIPALTLVEFQPKSGEVQGSVVLQRGTELRSDPVGDERTVCRFVTTQAVRLHPLRLQDVTLSWASDGTTSATLAFQLDGGVDIKSLKLTPLRLHFYANPTVASLMHLFFTRHVDRVVYRDRGMASLTGMPAGTAAGAEPKEGMTLHGQEWIRPGGLAPDEALLPEAAGSFSGFRLLQEYFAFRSKFWCVDLYGIDRLRTTPASGTFEVEVFFNASYPEDKRFNKDNVKLYCSPAVNLFAQDAEPIRVDHQSAELRVIPSTRHRTSMEVYQVERGVGMEEKTGRRHEYAPFFSFQHTKERGRRYFTASSRIGPTDHYETFLLIDSAEDDPNALVTESLSLELQCTNGSLPREKLRERMITQLAPEVPKVARPVNLTQPTLILYPPIKKQKDFFWRVISHWSINFQTLATTQALVGLLSLYDWSVAETANRRRIDGIKDVTWEPKEVMYRGAVLRGVEVHLRIQEGHFADEGDVCLFGLIMSHFLSTYATLNSFVHLTVEMIPSGKKYQWKPKSGTQPIL